MKKNKVNIGDNNKIKNSNIAGGDIDINSSKDRKPILNKIIIPIIVGVVVTVVGGILLYYIIGQ